MSGASFIYGLPIDSQASRRADGLIEYQVRVASTAHDLPAEALSVSIPDNVVSLFVDSSRPAYVAWDRPATFQDYDFRAGMWVDRRAGASRLTIFASLPGEYLLTLRTLGAGQ